MSADFARGYKAIVLFIVIVLILVAYLGVITFARKESKPCGGFAANLSEFQCSTGYICKSEGNYPDAAGKCVFILDIASFLF